MNIEFGREHMSAYFSQALFLGKCSSSLSILSISLFSKAHLLDINILSTRELWLCFLNNDIIHNAWKIRITI